MPKKNTTADLPAMEGPGVESVVGNPFIEELAERYAEKRDLRMEASKPEIEAKQKLVDAIHANAENLPRDQKTGALIYKNDDSGIFISLTPSKEKLKVRIKDVDAEDSEVDANE